MNSIRALAAVLLVVLTACTHVSGVGTGAGRATDVLHLDSATDPPGFDPLVFDNAQIVYFAPLIHGFLFRADGEGKMVPDLATVVPTAANGGISRDGRTVTYHLRRGLRWHDGAPFDARDVVFSFDAAMNPNNSVPDHTGFDHVAAVRALDPYTVQVRLTRPFSPFVPSCFTMAANDPYPILPAHLLAGKHDINRDPYNAAPIGLGPYKLVSWQRGSRIVLAADPHYYRGAPKIPRIEIAIIPDSNTIATVWNSGGIDFVPARVQAGRTFLDTIRKRGDARIVMQLHYEFDYVLLNLAHPPLDDVRVRRALTMGIDRHRIMQDLDGELWVPGETDRLPGQFAYDPTIVQPRYDPAAAARLLDAAGWRLGPDGVRRKNGRPLALQFIATTESRTTGRFSLLAQQQLAKIGVRTDLKEYGYNLLYQPKAQGGIYPSGRFDLTYFGWQPNTVADHSYLFRCDTRPPGGDNFGNICDPVIERAAREELDTTDPAREAAGDRAITRRVVEQSEVIFLGFNREAVAYRDDLEGVVPSVTGQHLWNVWAWRFRAK
ncbi:MAG TPA: peptide ABC transporter substrate-binding protein [Candidatus Elarobacter sp.]|jgi:peptide/nickel transport system substrate-binding protein|nr:peptide ABC transporter substrate-binding protein [Candidatus Elarobacter sp.]